MIYKGKKVTSKRKRKIKEEKRERKRMKMNSKKTRWVKRML